ncbi:MAG: AI-2E family transporter [Anaerolineae bacterium]|jgi:predicted PurR-regulated permease PerM
MSESVRSKWSAATKRTVVLVLMLLLALVVYRFRGLFLFLLLAFLLAFILDPLVDFLEARARMSRGGATVLVFVLLILALSAAPAVAVPPLVKAVSSLRVEFARIVADLDQVMAEPISLFGREWDLQSAYQELSKTLQTFLSLPSLAAGTFKVVVGFVSTLFWLLFILLSAFYLVKDADRIVAWMDSLPPPELQGDFVRLRQQITEVWHDFLRGQLVMAVLLALITTAVSAAVGLPNAPALGLLAGAMEFIPNVGPVIAAVPAAMLAFFEGSSWIPLSNLWFTVLVLGLYILIQQIEGNVLLPRVLGRSLNLHPLIVLIAIIAGGSLAGILGALLATPTVATLLVVGRYIYRRLSDQEPFAEEPQPHRARRGLGQWLWDLVRRRVLAARWVIRTAQPEDRADVEAVCARALTDDYIPEVWEKWLGDPHGELTVVEQGGKVVAVGKLTRLADEEWWLEGLRVDPAYRRLGVARLVQAHQVQAAQQLGRGTLRLATASYNKPIHRNAARDGFHRVGEFLYCRGEPLPGPCPLRSLTSDDFDVVWELIEGSPIFRAASGLYEVAWHWLNLTRERLANHLAVGDVWGIDLEERLAAVAILSHHPDKDRLSVGYLDGEPEGITALAWGLRVLTNQLGCDRLRVRPPLYPPLVEALEAAGVTRSRAYAVWVFERWLKGEVDDGGEND